MGVIWFQLFPTTNVRMAVLSCMVSYPSGLARHHLGRRPAVEARRTARSHAEASKTQPITSATGNQKTTVIWMPLSNFHATSLPVNRVPATATEKMNLTNAVDVQIGHGRSARNVKAVNPRAQKALSRLPNAEVNVLTGSGSSQKNMMETQVSKHLCVGLRIAPSTISGTSATKLRI